VLTVVVVVLIVIVVVVVVVVVAVATGAETTVQNVLLMTTRHCYIQLIYVRLHVNVPVT